MFKNLIVYRLAADWQPNVEKLEDALENERFVPCGATEALSAGWVPPRGEPGARLLEEIGDHWLLSLRMEKRVLPGSVVREKVEEMVERVEPGDRSPPWQEAAARHEGAGHAGAAAARVHAAIAPAGVDLPKQGFLMVDAGSIGKADELITLLVKADSSINLHLLQSAESPAACMAAWLMDGVPPKDFVIDRDCELKAADEMKAAVRYARHNLDTDEVKAHLTSGKMPTRLAMTWKERVSFTLTDTMQIKGIKFLDVVFDGRDKPAKDEAFDVDAALATGELAQLIPDMIEGLGGEPGLHRPVGQDRGGTRAGRRGGEAGDHCRLGDEDRLAREGRRPRHRSGALGLSPP